MQFTCIQQPQKLYYHRLRTVIGMCFWFSLERIIIVLQKKTCKSSLTLHQRGFTLGTWKYYSFYDRRCPWREKKNLCCYIHYRWSISITYHLYPFNIYLESLRIDLPFEKRPLLLQNVITIKENQSTEVCQRWWLHKERRINCSRSREDLDFLLFFCFLFFF